MGWLLLGLWACNGKDGTEVTPEPEPEKTYTLEVLSLPSAPDDPVIIDVVGIGERESVAHPDIRDARGERVPMVPLFSGSRLDGYVADGGFAEGTYEIVGSLEHETVQTEPFQIHPYGTQPVDASALVGRAWLVSDGTVLPVMFDELVWTQLGDLKPVIAIDQVGEQGVEFRVVLRTEAFDCLALRDRATLDETGTRLQWSEEEVTIELPMESGKIPVPLRDLSVELAWLAGDTASAWGQGRGVADFAATETSELPFCPLIEPLGAACQPCEGTDLATCFPAGAASILLEETAQIPASELPMCGVDRLSVEAPELPELPPLSCDFDLDFDLDLDFDCGCRVIGVQAGLPLALSLLLVIRRRRR